MISLFTLSIIIGAIILFFDRAAKWSSPAPSMYRTSGTGWIFIIGGLIGIGFVSLLP